MKKSSFLTLIVSFITLGCMLKEESVSSSSPLLETESSKITHNIDNQQSANPEQIIHNKINGYRRQQGLSPLRLDPRISDIARRHSQNMATGEVRFSHDGIEGRYQAINQVIPYGQVGENVAYNYGYSDPFEQAFQGWINSPGHQRNIVGNYTITGIGVAQNQKGEYYFTQLFVRQR